MSAVRNERRGTRLTKPYQRDVPDKKSSWSLSGLLSFLNPLRSTEPEEPSLPLTNQPSAGTLAARGHQMAQQMADQPRPTQFAPPPPPASQASLVESENPMLSIDQYLGQKKTLNETETQELMKFVHQHVAPVKKHEPFRFTSVPAATTTQSMPSLEQQQAPRRALSRNPNGVYRWEGGGSAKRNRYRSAAFGTSSNLSSGLKLRPPPETPKTDTKRRRVGNDVTTPASAPGVRSTAPSPPSKPNSPAKPTPPTTPEKVGTSRSMPSLRVAPPAKPSLPAIPSPLRQAWSQSDSPPTRQTKAASFMTELIKEVVPPPKPDVSNPYQTVCPVKPQGQPRKVSARRPRTTGKTSKSSLEPEHEKEADKHEELEKEKEPELPPHALIEATVPKGSKRSRPPAKSILEDLPAKSDPKVVEIEVEEPSIEEPVQKRSKKAMLNGHGFPPAQPSSVSYSPIVIEEVEDADVPSVAAAEVVEPNDDMSKATESPSVQINVNGASKHSGGGLKSSLPREPSKLRFSYQPEANGSPTSSPSPAAEKENQVIPPLPPTDAKSVARSTTTAPAFSFHVSPPSSPPSKAKQAALKSTLPSFDFVVDPNSMTSSSAAAVAAASAKKETLPSFNFMASASTSSAPTGFDWARAGMKAPEPKEGWTCDMCSCSNPSSAKDKCTVCDAPVPGAKASSSAPPTGFDWTKAGMAPPAPKEGWTCNMCSCSNPSNVKDKCTVCDAPAPGAKASLPAPSTGFDWAKAGMAPPAPKEGWTCDMCSCSNPSSAKDKCTVCEAPAPGAKAASSVPSTGFDWAAAGMAPPAPKEGWTCGDCNCSNPSSAKLKCTVCDAPAPVSIQVS